MNINFDSTEEPNQCNTTAHVVDGTYRVFFEEICFSCLGPI